MIYTLMIDTAGDAAFALVCLGYGAVLLLALCILGAIGDGIAALIDRSKEKKRRKCRNHYGRF